MEHFEILLETQRTAVERFVRYKIPVVSDAEDVLQEVYCAAYLQFEYLKSPEAFKPWLIGIARNKCSDYFRRKAQCLEIPLDTVHIAAIGRAGRSETEAVRQTLSELGDHDKQILYLYYWKELPQQEIARQLDIPLGTVKSRLHHAKQSFRRRYPYPPKPKGETSMANIMPEFIPDYTIEWLDEPAFPVRWEELMGWFLIPKLGEKLNWAMYDFPEKRRTEHTYMEVIGKAEVHGIEGVEIAAVERDPMSANAVGSAPAVERRFVAQLTDTHCRTLAESHYENGVRKYYTFLDGDTFLNNWGFGVDNCGKEVNIAPKGDITRQGDQVQTADKQELLDVVGRCRVTIGGKVYDTVCVMDVETYEGHVATEQFIDRNGRTVLWRRFNEDTWRYSGFNGKWSQRFPDNERLYINGSMYVHWYDCITDYIL